MSNRDAGNPFSATTSNDLGEELVQKVIEWYRGHRNSLTTSQQSAVITAITSVLNGTFKV